MAINLKEKKRVNRSNGSFYPQIIDGNQNPYFRSYGYEANGDKKPFALGFDALNSEYLRLDSNKSITSDGEFLEFEFKIISGSGFHFICSSFNQLDSIAIDTGLDRLFFRVNNVSEFFFTGTALPNAQGYYKIRIERVLGQLEITLNDTLTATATVGTEFNYETFPRGTTVGVDLIKSPIKTDSEDLVFDYGLGKTIKGTNGTIGTINTSAAQAKDRINYGIWQYFDGSNWLPYTKI